MTVIKPLSKDRSFLAQCLCCVIVALLMIITGCSSYESDPEDSASQPNQGEPHTPGVTDLMTSAKKLIESGGLNRNIQDYNKAEQLLRKALSTEPENDNVLLLLGKINEAKLDLDHKNRSKFIPVAVEMFEKTIQANPNNMDAYLGLANIYMHYVDSPGRFKSAYEVAEKALKIQPDNLVALNLNAECSFNLGHYERAEELFKKVLTKAVNDEYFRRRSREFLGRIYIKQKKYKEAEKVLKKAASGLEEYNKKYDAMYGCPYQALGELYSKLDQPEKSTDYFSKMADAEPKSADSQFYTAWKFFLHGDYTNALKYIHRSQQDNTSNLKAVMYALAEKTVWVITRVSGQELPESTKTEGLIIADSPVENPDEEFKAALDAYESEDILTASNHIKRALSKENLPKYKVLEGFVTISRRDYDRAEIIFNEILENDQSQLGAHAGIGHLNIIRKNNEKAKKHLHKVVKSSIPLDEKEATLSLQNRYDRFVYEMACLGMGWLLANQSRHEQAITYYDRILEYRPSYLLAMIGKGNSLSGIHRLDEAEKVLQAALDQYPGNKYAITELGIIHYNRGNYEEAEASLREALKKDADTYTCPYEGLGLVYLKKGKKEKAKEFFEKAIDINPDIEFKKYNGLAKIYIQEGKVQKARELLQKSIENYPYDEEASELLEKLNAESPAKKP